MFPLSALILGVINIAIVAAVLVFVGLLIAWFASWFKIQIDERLQRVYLIIVFLVCLYMLTALLLGLPMPGLLGSSR